MRGAVTGLCLLAAASAAQAGALTRHLHLRLFHSAHPFAVTVHDDGVHFRPDAAPLLGHGEARYQPQPSGLDRIDPSAMRVWGGEIGGEGVKGGAVVSLTWPTE